MSLNRAASLLFGASTLVLAWTANAQTPAKASAAADEELVEVVVTGSRVITNGNDSPTPVTVVTAEELTTVHPGNLAEALNDLPVFNGSRGQNSNTGTSGAAGSPATSTNAGNVVNLRQMGLLRSLVLYDGHRAPPSTPDGFVDLDTIPQMLLKRVDVVTGGVSAVYGSDGITGAVNFVTDTKFEGIKANLQAGRSTYQDANTAEGGIAFGTNLFGGRGHVMGSFETRRADPVASKFDRPWGANVYTLQGYGGVPAGTPPYYQVIGARQSNTTYGGRVNAGALNALFATGAQFSTGGTLIPFVPGTSLVRPGATGASTNCPTCQIGGDGAVYNGQLRAGLKMDQLFGRFDLDFSDQLHGYFTAAGTRNHSVATGNYFTNTNLTVSRDNAYLLPTYKTTLTTANQTTFALSKMFTAIPRGELDTTSKQLFVNTGLQGSLGNYKWDLSLVKSKGTFDVHQNAAINQGRFLASLDSVLSNGVAVCRASATNGAYAGCIPMNPFGLNSESQAAIGYFMDQRSWKTKIGMEDVSASITGAPFNSWAGPVNAAFSAEWRKLTYAIDSNTPDPTTARASCTVPGGTLAGAAATSILNCNANTLVYQNASVASLPEVSTKVTEAALEFGVPLLKDKSFAKSLDMNAAYRVAHYDQTGNAKTWKVGLTLDVFDKLTVRATRSRDFRAPALDEMFRVKTVSFTGFGDTLVGSAVPSPQNVRTENYGNPDLKPEVADTFTYGVVFRATDNLDFAVDAFDIKVKNAIFLIQGNTPDFQNACYASGGTSVYCQFIGRGLGSYTNTTAANAVNLWKQTFLNLAEQDTVGADIEVNYRTAIASRPVSLRLLSTYQPHLIYKQEGLPDYEYSGVAFGTNGLQANPRWRATGFVTVKPTDRVTVSVMERWRSSLPRFHADPRTTQEGSGVKSVAYTNLNLSYSPKMQSGKIDIFLNVQNLFNKDPPQAGFWGNPNPGQFGEFAFGDDIIGRYYTAGVRYQL